MQRRGNLSVEDVGRNIDIDNGRILVRLLFRDGGYAQEFAAVDRSGDFHLLLSSLHKNMLTSSEHRSCSSPMIAGDRPHLFGICRESLRMVYSQAAIIEHNEQRVIVELSGAVQDHSLKCRIALEDGADWVHVAVDDEIGRGDSEPLVEYLMSSFAFVPEVQSILDSRKMDYTWAPIMRPGGDHLIGDRAFHSPALVVQHANKAAALIPDIASLTDCRDMPAALDLDMNNGLLSAPLISYGFCGYEPTRDGRYCRHDMTMAKRLASPRLSYAFYLMLDADCRRKSAHRAVATFLWKTYGGPGPHIHVGPETQTATYPLPALSEDEFYDAAERSWQLSRPFDRLRMDMVQLCRSHADLLVNTRLRTGALQGWFKQDGSPIPSEHPNIRMAASVLFLARLGRAISRIGYIRAAERGAKFILDELVPKYSYQDRTLAGAPDFDATNYVDEHTGMRPQSGWGMLWTALMCLELYESTGAKVYLEHGLYAIDQLCLLQCVWDNPFADQPSASGMCVKGNVGWEPDPELTAEFAHAAMRYGSITGDKEYFERGSAAFKAAILSPVPHPHTQARIAACVDAIKREFGSAFVHVGKKWGVPVTSGDIDKLEFGHGDIILDIRPNGGGVDRVVFGGMRGKAYKIHTGGTALACTSEKMQEGVLLMKNEE
ncbi:MAG: hypothetical protein M1133_05140 [Armatimonadetes bacterium]|nr:hypothetical protein [Armatimonadota bacterium]